MASPSDPLPRHPDKNAVRLTPARYRVMGRGQGETKRVGEFGIKLETLPGTEPQWPRCKGRTTPAFLEKTLRILGHHIRD